jgi:hypothetical protein
MIRNLKLTASLASVSAPRPVVAPRAAPPKANPPVSGFETKKTSVIAAPVKERTKATAIAEARALIEGPTKESTTDQNATVVKDAIDANDASDTNKDSPRYKDAVGLVKANTVLETEALKKLSNKEKKQYAEIRKQLEADPVAQLALQTLLLEGKLPGPKEMGGDRKDTTLSNLNRLATQELGEGIDRAKLLADVTQEILIPECLAQKNKGTCTMSALQIQLLQKNPAEYVRLITGLSSKNGTIVTVGGDTLKREADSLTTGSSRTLSQQLMAPALMEMANGKDDYNNTEDQSGAAAPKEGYYGLNADQVDVALQSIYGRDFAVENAGSAKEKQAARELVETALTNGHSVLVGMQWGEGGHKVLVIGSEKHNGVDCIRYVNPWGRVELMPVTEFEKRIHNVNYDPNA